jgi:hypothetical protein
MKTLLKASLIAVFLAVLAAASGCEDSPATVGKDYQIYLLANPDTVNFDPQNPNNALTSTMVATIVNATVVPQKGINVFFSTTVGGTLDSNAQPVTTDSNGNAYDTLTVSPDGPAEVSITATSTSLTKTVKVRRTGGFCDTNTAPTAVITPSGTITAPAQSGSSPYTTPSLSGTSSTDPETPSLLLAYSWNCDNGSAAITGSTATCTYAYTDTAQQFTIELTVTDKGLSGHPECILSSTATVTVNLPAGTVVR